uniref:Uncharacterized protein n=1 Tax=Candidatus Kentrum sp. LPFa TaxID=2126335 RepID=A0A450XBH8_9GAMM|nr:MAG: hypothetical protein BECKLPF1236A_GA0070988_1003513 [Candidatus Kentron sp. LPFa]VFK26638.1 MAG: hypothetical protein BECKLPF1236C_GA0070990_1003713 [Candidatus Kentron sp. LPFa]
MKKHFQGRSQKLWELIKRISIIFIIIVALIDIHLFVQDARSTLDIVKLESLSHYLKLIDSDYRIRAHETTFANEEVTKAEDILKQEYLNAGKSTRDFYYSENAKDFREVSHHYEMLGLLLRFEYLDFETIFEIVPFPDKFWSDTTKIRRDIKENWAGIRQPLPGFLANFQWLCSEYKEARKTKGNLMASSTLKCE